MGIDQMVPALLCGNGILYKPSEFATLTGQLLIEVNQRLIWKNLSVIFIITGFSFKCWLLV
jgi:acyl-CoA reductase-like NAD-dependent aldehyde dehydrogenase